MQLGKMKEGNNIEYSIVADVQNFLNKEVDYMLEEKIPEADDNELEQLSEELIQVFSFDCINNSTASQKEKLIQRIIRLGGKDYIVEDLRRDILKIEMEEKSLDQYEKYKADKDESGLDSDDMAKFHQADLDKDNIVSKVYNEI